MDSEFFVFRNIHMNDFLSWFLHVTFGQKFSFTRNVISDVASIIF